MLKVKHQPALNDFLELKSGEFSSGSRLNSCDDEREAIVSHLLKSTKQTSFEEHLKSTKSFTLPPTSMIIYPNIEPSSL